MNMKNIRIVQNRYTASCRWWMLDASKRERHCRTPKNQDNRIFLKERRSKTCKVEQHHSCRVSWAKLVAAARVWKCGLFNQVYASDWSHTTITPIKIMKIMTRKGLQLNKQQTDKSYKRRRGKAHVWFQVSSFADYSQSYTCEIWRQLINLLQSSKLRIRTILELSYLFFTPNPSNPLH